MDSKEKAIQRFSEGSNCAQAVFSAFAPRFGLEPTTAHQIATGFGAGLGRKQLVCGAISGGAMVISLKYGNRNLEGHHKKAKTYEEVQQFLDTMEKKLGSCNCLDILGIDISTEEGMQKAKEKNLFDTTCANCVSVVSDYLKENL